MFTGHHSSDMEFIKTSRGGLKLCFEGYVYLKSGQYAKQVDVYECELRRKSKCNGKLKVKNGKIIGKSGKHSHDPDPNRVHVLKAVQTMKAKVQAADETPQEIISKTVEELGEGVAAVLPSVTHLKRTLRYCKRRHENANSPPAVNTKSSTTSSIQVKKQCLSDMGSFERDLVCDESPAEIPDGASTNLVEPSSNKVEFVRSSKGGLKVCFEGYVYLKSRNHAKNVVLYECELRRKIFCRARIKVLEDKLVAKLNNHCHKADTGRVQLLKALQEMKRKIRTEADTPHEIVSQVVAKLGEGVASNLPKLDTLKRTLRNCRQRYINSHSEDINIPDEQLEGQNFADAGFFERYLIDVDSIRKPHTDMDHIDIKPNLNMETTGQEETYEEYVKQEIDELEFAEQQLNDGKPSVQELTYNMEVAEKQLNVKSVEEQQEINYEIKSEQMLSNLESDEQQEINKESSRHLPDSDIKTASQQSSDVVFVKTSRGGLKLCFEGFVYLKTNQYTNQVFLYECESRQKLKCKAKIKYKDGEIIERLHNHSHEPDTNKVHVLKAVEKMKTKVLTANETPHEIISQTVQEMGEGLATNLPCAATLKRTLRYCRSRQQKAALPSTPRTEDASANEQLEEHQSIEAEPTEPDLSDKESEKQIATNMELIERPASTVEFLRTNRGGLKLCYEGFIYLKSKEYGGQVVLFECEFRQKLKCKAKIRVKDNKIIGRSFDHSHEPNEDKIQILRALQEMKAKAQIAFETPHEIVSQTLEKLGEGLAANLPAVDHLKRTVRYCRQKQNFASFHTLDT